MSKLTHFNNILALVLVGVIFLIWGLDARGTIHLDGTVKGATTSVFTMVAVFYFRKSPPVDTKPS